jgi:hypothetical protein
VVDLKPAPTGNLDFRVLRRDSRLPSVGATLAVAHYEHHRYYVAYNRVDKNLTMSVEQKQRTMGPAVFIL